MGKQALLDRKHWRLLKALSVVYKFREAAESNKKIVIVYMPVHSKCSLFYGLRKIDSHFRSNKSRIE